MAKTVTFNVLKEMGSFGERETSRFNKDEKAWEKKHETLKIQYGSWGEGKEPKFDIRPWFDDGTPDKGLTLTAEELEALYTLINSVLGKEA